MEAHGQEGLPPYCRKSCSSPWGFLGKSGDGLKPGDGVKAAVAATATSCWCRDADGIPLIASDGCQTYLYVCVYRLSVQTNLAVG